MKKLLTLCMSVLIAMQLFPCRAVIADPLAPEAYEAVNEDATEPLTDEERAVVGGEAAEPLVTEGNEPEGGDATDPLVPEENVVEEDESDDGNATDSLVPEEDVTEENEPDGGDATEPLAVEESKAEAEDVIEEEQVDVESSVSLQADPDKKPETIGKDQASEDNRTVLIEDGPTAVSLGTGTSIEDEGRRINITRQTFYIKPPIDQPEGVTVTYPEPEGFPETQRVADMTGSYMTVAPGVVLIQETDPNWFTASSSLTVGTGSTLCSEAELLKEGARVLILETNGTLRGYYAGAGTNSSTLVLGDQMSVYQGITHAHIATNDGSPIADSGLKYDYGLAFPLLPVSATWGEGLKSYFTTGPFESWLYLHLDVEIDTSKSNGYTAELKVNDCSIEFAYDDNELHLDGYQEIGKNVPLFSISGEVGEVIDIGISGSISFDGTGYGTTKFDASVKEGCYLDVGYDFPASITVVDKGLINEHTVHIDHTDQVGEFYIAYSVGPEISVGEVVGFGASYKGGAVLKSDKCADHVYPWDPNVWHACEDDEEHECICGDAHMRLGPASLEFIALGWTFPITSSDPKDFDPFYYFYDSKTFNDHGGIRCPHIAYKLNALVKDKATGKQLPNATVSYAEVPAHYEPVSSAVTGSDGKALIYVPKGEGYSATAVLVSPINPFYRISQTLPFDKAESEEDITFELDIPVKHVYFKNSQTGQATDWPKDLDFQPFFSLDVTLPDEIPSLSGRQFIGWNTEQDGSGTYYMPGTTITSRNDVTLWAQWEIPGDRWFVIFNAKGGTKAPMPQIVQRGTDAVLTTELPENGDMVFMGWTTNASGPGLVYQPGDTLPYDSSKSYVVLYAMWNMIPVDRPVIVTFDANGGLPDTVPHTASALKGVSFNLPETEPSWDPQHPFLGWSTNPKATEPMWKAGDEVAFDQDMTLYAVWHPQYKVIEGADSVWVKDSGRTQRFVADGNFQYFRELKIDGRTLRDGVEFSSGSTIADISAKTMETLSVGDHTVTFVYMDGEASAKFSVSQSGLPATGDTVSPTLRFAPMALSVTGLVLIGAARLIAKKEW